MWVQLPDPLSAFLVFNFRWVCAVGGSGNETSLSQQWGLLNKAALWPMAFGLAAL